MEFQASDVSISNDNKKKKKFYWNIIFSMVFLFKFKILFVTSYYFYHKLTKFEQNRMIRTAQKLDLFEKQLIMLRVFSIKLPSFIIQKITEV